MTNEVDANNHKDLKEKEKKHDSGAADLEKVTDYAEEKEIGSSSAAEDAIAVISKVLCAKIQICEFAILGRKIGYCPSVHYLSPTL